MKSKIVVSALRKVQKFKGLLWLDSERQWTQMSSVLRGAAPGDAVPWPVVTIPVVGEAQGGGFAETRPV